MWFSNNHNQSMMPLKSLMEYMKGEEKGALCKVCRNIVGVDKDIMWPERDIKSPFFYFAKPTKRPLG